MKHIRMINRVLLVCALFTLLACSAFASGSMDNFYQVDHYADGQFTDVPASDWECQYVSKAYEYGLMNGKSETKFMPWGNLTVGEAVTLASRLNNAYMGRETSFESGSPWYQTYVDYAVENGIITEGQFTDYNRAVTRAEFSGIFAHALPEEELKERNKITAIPDVSDDDTYADEIYLMYRAGILTGTDDYGTFSPDAKIERAAAAAIVCRMAIPGVRCFFTPKDFSVPTSISMLSANTKILKGASVRLTVNFTPAFAEDQTLAWSSSDPAVASVTSDGTVTGLKAGSAVITAASVNGLTASCTVTVSATDDRHLYFYDDDKTTTNALWLADSCVSFLTVKYGPADTSDLSALSDVVVAKFYKVSGGKYQLLKSDTFSYESSYYIDYADAHNISSGTKVACVGLKTIDYSSVANVQDGYNEYVAVGWLKDNPKINTIQGFTIRKVAHGYRCEENWWACDVNLSDYGISA